MQIEVDEFCEALARAELNKNDNEDESDDDEDFGLYYPRWYVFDTWLEHKNHHTYPEPGGYNDQDAQLMIDWQTINARFNRQLRMVAKGQSDELSLPAQANDWTDLT